MVADEQHRTRFGDVAQPADLAAEVEACQQPEPRQRLADVVGVALVEVGDGDAVLNGACDRAYEAPGESRRRRALRRGLVLADLAVGRVAVQRPCGRRARLAHAASLSGLAT